MPTRDEPYTVPGHTLQELYDEHGRFIGYCKPLIKLPQSICGYGWGCCTIPHCPTTTVWASIKNVCRCEPDRMRGEGCLHTHCPECNDEVWLVMSSTSQPEGVEGVIGPLHCQRCDKYFTSMGMYHHSCKEG